MSRNSSVNKILKNVVFLTLLSSVISIFVTFISGHKAAILSIAIGTIIAILSFLILAIVVIQSMKGGGRAVIVAILGMLKMVFVGGILWLLLRHQIVTPIAFLIGFSTMVVALLIEGIWSSFQS